MLEINSFPPIYGRSSDMYPLINEIQQTEFRLQIRDKVGSDIWKTVFLGCTYKLIDNCLFVIAPTKRAAEHIAVNYLFTLEELFGVAVILRAENQED